MLQKPFTIFLSIFFLLSLGACSDPDEKISTLEELIVVTRNAPTTWYVGREGAVGLEYDLMHSFAQHEGLKIRTIVVDTISDVVATIHENKAHIAAAGITDTEVRKDNGYMFGPAYQTVQQQVVCRRGQALPRSVTDLIGKKITVISDSSYQETLQQLKQEHPLLAWQVESDVDTEQLLEQVWLKKIDCTIADSNIVSINRRYYPELVVAFPVSDEQSLAWIVSPQWPGLQEKLETWLNKIESNGELAVIKERYYGHVDIYDYVDIRRFTTRIKKRLPKYVDYFKEAAKQYQLPWKLLAAQAYQESHWNPNAKSPTGVRGMMMLTLNTAKDVDVTNRLDPKQSIMGGARYMKKMMKRVPESVVGDDRTWFALAAYNVGFGHLRDARELATRFGKNPDRWVDLKEVLPLLAQRKYYKTVKYGYARGTEPVRYVQGIREYRQILERDQ